MTGAPINIIFFLRLSVIGITSWCITGYLVASISSLGQRSKGAIKLEPEFDL
jgi:uncharacterized protein with PQ loop repeat